MATLLRWARLSFLALALVILLIAHLVPLRWGALTILTVAHIRLIRDDARGDGATIASARALVTDLTQWRAELRPLTDLAPYLSFLPRYGGVLKQVPQLTALTDDTLAAVNPSLELYGTFGESRAQGLAPGEAVLQVSDQTADLEHARQAVVRAVTTSENIPLREFPPELHQPFVALRSALTDWSAALALLERAPALLGAERPRRYLILAQNNDELRPTGGFISAVGVLRVDRGELVIEWFGDSYAADDLTRAHPPPPAPLEKYMWASQWLLRDSNWYAHFPTSAGVAQSMWARDRHQRVDGVIALDMRLLPRLIHAVDGLTLGDTALTANNVTALLREQWQPLPPGDMSAAWFTTGRKSFLGELMQGFMGRLSQGEIRPPALAAALLRGLDEKSLQIYLDDPLAQTALERAGWTGAVASSAGDSLFVVDSNVGFNKVNSTVSRHITYSIAPTANGGSASVEITYANPAPVRDGGCDLHKQHKDNTYASMQQSCYWNYVRVLAPPDSQLVHTDGITDAGTGDEGADITAFGGYVILPRAETRTVRFDYHLSGDLLSDDTYTLLLHQQAGGPPTPITVRVTLPERKTITNASHPFTMHDSRTVHFDLTLYNDNQLEIYLSNNQ